MDTHILNMRLNALSKKIEVDEELVEEEMADEEALDLLYI